MTVSDDSHAVRSPVAYSKYTLMTCCCLLDLLTKKIISIFCMMFLIKK